MLVKGSPQKGEPVNGHKLLVRGDPLVLPLIYIYAQEEHDFYTKDELLSDYPSLLPLA